VLSKLAKSSKELLGRLSLPGADPLENVSGSYTLVRDDAQLDFEIVDVRVNGAGRITLQLGHILFETSGQVLLRASHNAKPEHARNADAGSTRFIPADDGIADPENGRSPCRR
jgi:hypothetical protein